MKEAETVLSERRRSHKISPYGYDLTVFVTNSVHESYNRRIKWLPSPIPPNPNASAFVWRAKGFKDIVAFLPENCPVGTIAHEMLHVVKFVMESVGAGFDEEVWAYHLDDLTQLSSDFVYQQVEKKTSKGRKK